MGQAELLCACLSIPALRLYMWAVDTPPHAASRPGGGRRALPASPLLHWMAVCGALLLAWAAALSKEIGIAMVGGWVGGWVGGGGGHGVCGCGCRSGAPGEFLNSHSLVILFRVAQPFTGHPIQSPTHPTPPHPAHPAHSRNSLTFAPLLICSLAPLMSNCLADAWLLFTPSPLVLPPVRLCCPLPPPHLHRLEP